MVGESMTRFHLTKASEDRNWWNLINFDGNCYRRCGKRASRLKPSDFVLCNELVGCLKLMDARTFYPSLLFLQRAMFLAKPVSRFYWNPCEPPSVTTTMVISRECAPQWASRSNDAIHRLPGRRVVQIFSHERNGTRFNGDYYPWHWLDDHRCFATGFSDSMNSQLSTSSSSRSGDILRMNQSTECWHLIKFHRSDYASRFHHSTHIAREIVIGDFRHNKKGQ